MNVLERNIRQFVDDFFDYLIARNQCKELTSDSYPNSVKSVDFGDNFCLRLLSAWGEKRFYLTVFNKNRYLLELFLCRMLFNGDGTITWYLDTPSRKENVKIYKGEEIPLQEIPYETVEEIREQQEKLHSGRRFNKVNKGYLIAQNTPKVEIFERLEAVIFSIIGKKTMIPGPDNSDTFILEGITEEIFTSKRSRTRRFIEPVKLRDGYKCQACGLSLSVNGSSILQVHHLKPLVEEVKTTMKDLVSLCPTCHFIAHKNTPPYTISEVKEIIEAYKLTSNL